MRTAADLRRAAANNGLHIVGVERVPVAGGGTALSTRMRFRDPWAAARLLKELSDEDACDPVVRAWALEILKRVAQNCPANMQGPVVAPSLVRDFNRAVHANVQRQIRFVREPRETFQAARVTMRSLAGDCDDHARLVHSLTKAAGGKSRLVFFAKDGQPVHVVAQTYDPGDVGPMGAWQWAETTIPAAYGEDPHAAFVRLKNAGRIPYHR